MGRYQVYPKYKSSEVDWFDSVPAHWEIKRISYFAQLKSGDAIVSEQIEAEGEYPVFGGNGFRGYTSNYTHEGHYILIGRQGALCGNINYGEGKFWASEHAVVVHPFLAVNTKWLGETLRAMNLNQYNVSAAQPGLAVANITCLKIPFPSYAEQGAIANFLDHETAKIDTLIEKQQQLIQLLKEKRQAVISHAVTKGLNPNAPMKDSGVEWLGEVPEHWDIGKIKNLSHVISKGTTPSTMGAEFETSGIRFLKAENIGKGFHATTQPEFYISKQTDEQLARSRLRDRDVLVIIAGATTGQASLITEELLPANTNQAVSFIRPINPEYSEYIVYWLSTEYAQSNIWQNAVQAAQPNLSMETLGNIYIPIPPKQEVVPLVFEIQKKLLKLSHVIENAEKAIQFMQERRTALISAAVTGKIDVRNWQVNAMQSMESN